MSKNIIYFIDGISNAFSFSGKNIKITKRAKQAKHYSCDVSTNSKENFRKSISSVSSSIHNVTI